MMEGELDWLFYAIMAVFGPVAFGIMLWTQRQISRGNKAKYERELAKQLASQGSLVQPRKTEDV
jgi:hypothetical protein